MVKLPGALANLSEDQYDKLIAWLALGLSDGEIVKKIQNESGWLLDVKPATLLKNVNRWRKQTPAQNAIVKSVAEKLMTPTGKLRRHLDVIDELTDLAVQQKTRLEKLAKTENNSPLLLESLSIEMMRLTTILEKLGKFQLETGLMRRVRVGQIASDYEEPEVADEVGGLWTPEVERHFTVIDAEFKEITA